MSASKLTDYRFRPPGRRLAITETLSTQGRDYTVTVGIDPGSGKPIEAWFQHRGKAGGDLDVTLYDAGVLLSLAVQHGTPIRALHEKCAQPTSPVGLALQMMKEIDDERLGTK